MICLFGSAQERSLATARATTASAADATKPRAYGGFNRLNCIRCPSAASEASYRINEDQVRGLLRAREFDSANYRSGHVWTAPAVQEESDYQRSVRVRSCIRPLSAAVWPLALM